MPCGSALLLKPAHICTTSHSLHTLHQRLLQSLSTLVSESAWQRCFPSTVSCNYMRAQHQPSHVEVTARATLNTTCRCRVTCHVLHVLLCLKISIDCCSNTRASAAVVCARHHHQGSATGATCSAHSLALTIRI